MDGSNFSISSLATVSKMDGMSRIFRFNASSSESANGFTTNRPFVVVSSKSPLAVIMVNVYIGIGIALLAFVSINER